MICFLDLTPSAGPAAHGRNVLLAALDSRELAVSRIRSASEFHDGLLVIAGAADHEGIQAIAEGSGIQLPETAESTLFQPCRMEGRDGLLASGADSPGVMYTLLELAERVRLHGIRALEQPEPFRETPRLRVRGVNRFLMGPLDDEWWQSDDFWDYFLDRIAAARLNRFVLITGFDTAWMSPPYPFFVEVPGYEQVTVTDLRPGARKSNLARLRQVGTGCARRGIEFFFGIWQQVPWQEGQSRIVNGLPRDEDALARYCAAGLQTLLVQCPEINGIHLRVNHEAGVGTERTPEGFWNTLTDAVADCGRLVKLDLRAKGLSDGMIRHALGRGLKVGVPTKYWCEQTGLPYHLSQMRSEEMSDLSNLNKSRRYSYADLLRRPREYEIIYRLWNFGATNLFLWGDPDYVKRFCASMEVGKAPGFEFTTPLSLKGGHALHHRKPWPVFTDPELVSHRWEDERYWYQYVLFGRIGYDPDTAEEILLREFSHRFGPAAGKALARACHFASGVIPLVTAAHMPAHPMVHYWPELSTGGALFPENQQNPHFRKATYGASLPSDQGLFCGIEAFATDLMAGTVQAKYTPLQVSAHLRTLVTATHEHLEAACASTDLLEGSEWRAAVNDLRMVADLGAAHAAKILAALHLELYRRTGSPGHLREARGHLQMSREHWASLAERGTQAYHNPLEFRAGPSTGRSGHWSDALAEFDRDLISLDALPESKPPAAPRPGVSVEALSEAARMPNTPPGCIFRLPGEVSTPDVARPDNPVMVKFTPPEDCPVSSVTLHYRHTDQTEGPFRSVEMQLKAGHFEAGIPTDYVNPEFDLLLYLSSSESPYVTRIFPGLHHPNHPLPYLVLPVSPDVS